MDINTALSGLEIVLYLSTGLRPVLSDFDPLGLPIFCPYGIHHFSLSTYQYKILKRYFLKHLLN
jgi:hypothetical protein